MDVVRLRLIVRLLMEIARLIEDLMKRRGKKATRRKPTKATVAELMKLLKDLEALR